MVEGPDAAFGMHSQGGPPSTTYSQGAYVHNILNMFLSFLSKFGRYQGPSDGRSLQNHFARCSGFGPGHHRTGLNVLSTERKSRHPCPTGDPRDTKQRQLDLMTL
jgi:hypothetical protein